MTAGRNNNKLCMNIEYCEQMCVCTLFIIIYTNIHVSGALVSGSENDSNDGIDNLENIFLIVVARLKRYHFACIIIHSLSLFNQSIYLYFLNNVLCLYKVSIMIDHVTQIYIFRDITVNYYCVNLLRSLVVEDSLSPINLCDLDNEQSNCLLS